MEISSTVLTVIAIVAAFGLIGVVGIEVVKFSQEAEAIGCKTSTPFVASQGRCFRG